MAKTQKGRKTTYLLPGVTGQLRKHTHVQGKSLIVLQGISLLVTVNGRCVAATVYERLSEPGQLVLLRVPNGPHSTVQSRLMENSQSPTVVRRATPHVRRAIRLQVIQPIVRRQ